MKKVSEKSLRSIEDQISLTLKNRDELELLLYLVKERRGLGRDKLAFIAMANIAAYYWCAMKSFYKSREIELDLFGCYLYDRVLYSYRLGLFDKLPENKTDILEIGDNIGFSDIEKLLEERAMNHTTVTMLASAAVDKDSNRIMLINPNLSDEERMDYEKQAESQGRRVVSFYEAPPKLRGVFLENAKAERYPTIRWNFAWHSYSVIGLPDGITNEFVYEFKSTRNRFLMTYIKPVAMAQTDLYGFFFKRSQKRNQIYIIKDNATETWDNQVNVTGAEYVLNEFKKIEEGLVPKPPKVWKCKSCEFKETCVLMPRRLF